MEILGGILKELGGWVVAALSLSGREKLQRERQAEKGREARDQRRARRYLKRLRRKARRRTRLR